MQKIFFKRLIVTVFISMLVVLAIGYFWSKENAIDDIEITSRMKINQIEQILERNRMEIDTLKSATFEDYLSRAEAVAYIITNNPGIATNNKELAKIAGLMQIDEIHIFDAKGVIVAGTVAEYIGVGVDDGVQIGYFRQILQDSSLKLVQEISPATADNKLMQYIGLGRIDKPGIIQIGMKPERMLEALKRNELSDVLSTITTTRGEDIYIVDKITGDVLVTTNDKYSELNFYDFEFGKKNFEKFKAEGYLESNNERGFSALKESNDVLICVFKRRDVLLKLVQADVQQIAFLLFLISIFMIYVINWLLKRHVISGIKKIIYTLEKITEGKLSTIVTVNNNPEFKELSAQINLMVEYLLNFTSKISHIIESVDVNIGMYEYRNDMEKVFTTSRLASILGFTSNEASSVFNDKNLFQEKLMDIYQGECDGEDNMIYRISNEAKEHYIKITSFTDSVTTLGIAIDVTDHVLRRNVIMHERDYDMLSNLYNRRAFMRESDKLFSAKETLKIACLFMADMDNLKTVNDKYGHEAGDRYIKAGANMMNAVKDVDDRTLIARLSGDEFVVMWYGYDGHDEIIDQITKLQNDMKAATIIVGDEQEYPVSFSAGYVFFPEHSEEKHDLLYLADMAMYHAKQNGKEKFVQYTTDLQIKQDHSALGRRDGKPPPSVSS